jgi:peptidoglycan/xylan/chitin deacetylase (PgdA/CDA1 family)
MEIGSHGMFHRDWRTLSQRELNVEINESKRILQDIIGQEIKNASCPYGSYDRSVLGYLSNAGFEKVYTSDRGRAQSKWWVQPRNSLHNTDDSRTLAMIMTQPHSLRESFVSYTKRFVKRWR